MEFHIPTLKSSDDADALKKTLLVSEPEADISIDVDQKLVTVDSGASKETFQQLITAAGHKVS